MTGAIIFFIVSLAVVLLLVAVKIVSLKKGREAIPAGFKAKSDAFLSGKSSSLKRAWAAVNRKNAMLVSHEILSFLSHVLHFFHRKVSEKRDMISEDIKKKSVLQKKGSSSQFLKNISEIKDKN